MTLYALGLQSEEDIDAIMDAALADKATPVDTQKWS